MQAYSRAIKNLTIYENCPPVPHEISTDDFILITFFSSTRQREISSSSRVLFLVRLQPTACFCPRPQSISILCLQTFWIDCYQLLMSWLRSLCCLHCWSCLQWFSDEKIKGIFSWLVILNILKIKTQLVIIDRVPWL